MHRLPLSTDQCNSPAHTDDLGSRVTHRFKLDQIEEAYDLFANRRGGVLKVAITP